MVQIICFPFAVGQLQLIKFTCLFLSFISLFCVLLINIPYAGQSSKWFRLAQWLLGNVRLNQKRAKRQQFFLLISSCVFQAVYLILDQGWDFVLSECISKHPSFFLWYSVSTKLSENQPYFFLFSIITHVERFRNLSIPKMIFLPQIFFLVLGII